MHKFEFKSKVIIFAFCLSIICTSIIYLNFDKTSYSKSNIPHNELIKGDTTYFFYKAEIFKKNIETGKVIDVAGEYQGSLLYPVLIGFYYNIFNEDLFEKELINNTKIVNSTNIKFFFLLIQTAIYFLSVFFLISSLKNILPSNILNFISLFLVFEPTIFQFHSLFMTESLYLAFLNFLLGILVKPTNKIYNSFFLGVFLGIAYLLKTISIFFSSKLP